MPISAYSEATPDKAALIFEPSGRRLTYRELDDRSLRLANLLRAQGLGRGDHVAVLMENHPRYMEVVLAALRSGLYITTVNRYLSAPEAAYILEDCDAQALITSRALSAVATEALDGNARCRLRLMVDAPSPGFAPYEASIAEHEPVLADPVGGDFMLYSSGTTGRPKGIQRPLSGEPFEARAARNPIGPRYGFGPNMVYLSPAPLYHAAPVNYVLTTLTSGGTAVVMEHFEPTLALSLIEAHQVSHSQWVPTMFVRMLKLDPNERVRFDLGSHRCAVHAAAPCPPDVKRQMIAWWGPILEEYYGSSEGIGNTRVSSTEWLSHPGSVGRPDRPDSVHICDERGRELSAGEAGLIYLEQPPGPIFTYHGDPQKTADSRHPDHRHWVTVGDIGRLDPDGFLYLTDRQSFMIISGGVNIYPQAIEDAMIMHPAVADVAVIGAPHPEMGEEVRAVVELRQGVPATDAMAATLIDFVRPRVARYAVPRAVDFTDALPRLPTGKLYKKALRDSYWAETPQA